MRTRTEESSEAEAKRVGCASFVSVALLPSTILKIWILGSEEATTTSLMPSPSMSVIMGFGRRCHSATWISLQPNRMD